MRRILRRILWFEKGVLIVITLVALFLWPWSYAHQGLVYCSQSTVWPSGEVVTRLFAGVGNGRIGLAEMREEHPGWASRDRSASWQWHADSEKPWFLNSSSPHSWGPIRWGFEAFPMHHFSTFTDHMSVPLWVVALVTGAWPFASLAFAFRRRARRQRMARAGHCAKCDYDLRATPAEGGEVLPQCPECGTCTSALGRDESRSATG